MKNFFKNFRSYSFWVSLCGAFIILLNALGRAFGFEIENQIVEDVLMSVAGVLVVLGVVTKPNKSDEKDNNQEEILQENQEKLCENEENENSETKEDNE